MTKRTNPPVGKVLVACEFSGRVRDAFIRNGHDAVSCDLIESDAPGPHILGCAKEAMRQEWDLIIAFPPCIYLCSSGARWWKQRRAEQREAVGFFLSFTKTKCGRVCIENPVGIMGRIFRPADQVIHPWMFGHGEVKTTNLWLKGLPPLLSTKVVTGRKEAIHRMTCSPDRSKLRSLTYQGVADAMADQWSSLL